MIKSWAVLCLYDSRDCGKLMPFICFLLKTVTDLDDLGYIWMGDNTCTGNSAFTHSKPESGSVPVGQPAPKAMGVTSLAVSRTL